MKVESSLKVSYHLNNCCSHEQGFVSFKQTEAPTGNVELFN